MRLTEKRRQVRESNPRELEQMLKDERKALFALRQAMSTQRLDNPRRIRETRKSIARILTIMRERESAQEKGQG